MRTRALSLYLAAAIGVIAQPTVLLPNRTVERTLAGTAVHSYTIELEAGQFLRAVVDQRGVDVVVRVFSPDNAQILEMDSPNGDRGPEPVEFQAKVRGSYRVDVQGLDPTAPEGKYAASIVEVLSPAQYQARLERELQRLDKVRAWISANAVRLTGVTAGRGFEDMQPLRKIVGNARVVALGEATHGTREFFEFKHRMLEFLASEMGFTVFAIEATMPEAFDLNRYVLTGQGDPAKLLSGLYFWTWDTEEVLDMIRWMRRFNEDPKHTRKLKFYGFDMQFPARAVDVALAYLERFDATRARSLGETLAPLRNPFAAPNFYYWPAGRRAKIAEAVKALSDSLDRLPLTPECRIARRHARLAVQFATPTGTAVMALVNNRDIAMAENIRWILEQEGPESRMVVWAHNAHVGRNSSSGFASMGAHLDKALGANMVVFGFCFAQGSFQAVDLNRGLRSFTLPPAPAGSLDQMLAASGAATAVVDMRTAPAGDIRNWFGELHPTRSIGAIFSDAQAVTLVSDRAFPGYDALLFVERTTAARANPGGVRPLIPPSSQVLAAARNLDFESGEALDGWRSPTAPNAGYRTGITAEGPAQGRRSAYIARTPGAWSGKFAGELQQTIEARPYRGKRIRLTASVRTSDTDASGGAHLLLKVAGPPIIFAPMCIDDMAEQPIRAEDWREYHLECDVPAGAERISFGLALNGSGRAFIDGVSVETVR